MDFPIHAYACNACFFGNEICMDVVWVYQSACYINVFILTGQQEQYKGHGRVLFQLG